MLTNILVALILAGAIAGQVMTDRQSVLAETYRDTENLVDLLAEHTRQLLGTIDLALLTMADAVAPSGAGGSRDADAIHDLLRGRQSVSAATYAFFVVDVDGVVFATSRMRVAEPLDLSGSPAFTALRDSADIGLFVGPPVRGIAGEATGRWLTPVARRIGGPDGEFAGTVSATLSLDYLLDFYRTLHIGEQGVVGLFADDGTLIVSRPFVEENIGIDRSTTELFEEMLARGDSGRFRGIYGSDDVERISAFRRVRDAPVIVHAGTGEAEALSGWRQRTIFHITIGALALTLFTAGSVATRSYVARRREWEENRSARLKLLAEESVALGKCRDEKSLLQRATQAARGLIGAHTAVASLTREGDFAKVVHVADLSDRYAAWRDYHEKPTGSGIYRLVCERNSPMLMSQAELEAHPAWKGFGEERDRHPPLDGWLAVPIVGHGGDNLGLIQLSHKKTGEFNQDDVNEMTQLAAIMGVAIENLQASEAREEALAAANAARAETETILASISDAMYVLDHDWRFVYLNAEAERLMQRRKDELLGQSVWAAFPDTVETVVYKEFVRAREQQVPVRFELWFEPLNAWFSARAFPHAQGLTVYFQNVTRSREAEERLRQSQKMDAIGQLTGGVAHDFNNLLTVILGNADSAAERLSRAPAEAREFVDNIRRAGERAAELTHRLLAFGRRQPLDPRPTDVNKLIAGLESMLTRTLGAPVGVQFVRGDGLWTAVVDPGELENAILNLALNARDAMPNGGRLKIETANRVVNAAVDSTGTGQIDIEPGEIDIEPGEYVTVAVSDTGAGMAKEVAQKAFEPFFTTKETGKGSGLGLSMVYGFVRQSGGHARIHSAPGEGTTVRLYLRRSPDAAGAETRRGRGLAIPRGSERILVVEDDEQVRRHVVQSLRRLGYQVVDCADGRDGLQWLDDDTAFQLLLTDVVLPGSLSGRQVAEEALRRVPGLKVLYMSGYSADAIVHHGRLDPGIDLLPKPFRLADLARKVRDLLDG